jgi:hypothetical protein
MDRDSRWGRVLLTLRIFGACEKYLLSEYNGFPDQAFGHEWEILREPGVDPAFERADAGDAFGSKQPAPLGR